jgi:hypothetical protein
MTLDERSPIVEHRALKDWERDALRYDAEEAAIRKREADVLEDTESVEARESHWRGVFAAAPKDVIHYPEPACLPPSSRGPYA